MLHWGTNVGNPVSNLSMSAIFSRAATMNTTTLLIGLVGCAPSVDSDSAVLDQDTVPDQDTVLDQDTAPDTDTDTHTPRPQDVECDTSFIASWPDPQTYTTEGQAGSTCDLPTPDTYRVAVFQRHESLNCILPPHFVSRPLTLWQAYADQPNTYTEQGNWPRPVVGGGCALPPADVGPIVDPGFLTECPANNPNCCQGHTPVETPLCDDEGLWALGYLGYVANHSWCVCDGDPVVPINGSLYDADQQCWAQGTYFGPATVWRETACRTVCEDAPMSFVHPDGTCLLSGSTCAPEHTQPPCGQLTLYEGDKDDCPDATRQECP